MEEKLKPFELRHENDRKVLWLHGTEDQLAKVDKDKVPVITDAIVQGSDIDIEYAVIDGYLDIRDVEGQLEQNDEHWVVKGNLRIIRSEIHGYSSFSLFQFIGVTDFRGTKFVENVDFMGTRFAEAACFSHAQFGRNIDFTKAQFNSNADFQEAQFRGYAKFSAGQFIKNVNFGRAKFSDNVDFREARFGRDAGNADFIKAQFSGNVDFVEAQFSDNTDFSYVTFAMMADFANAAFCRQALFHQVHFDMSVNLSEARFLYPDPESFDSVGKAYRKSFLPGSGYFFQQAGEASHRRRDLAASYSEEYLAASESFRNAKAEYEAEGDYDKAGDMYVKEKEAMRLHMRERKNKSELMKRVWLLVWKHTCKYGESPWRFVRWVAILIILFALLYMPIIPIIIPWWPGITFREYPFHKWSAGIIDGSLFNLITAIYYSAVTFATLGFGDIAPVNIMGKACAIIEVLMGYSMFGILITLVARKMTRG